MCISTKCLLTQSIAGTTVHRLHKTPGLRQQRPTTYTTMESLNSRTPPRCLSTHHQPEPSPRLLRLHCTPTSLPCGNEIPQHRQPLRIHPDSPKMHATRAQTLCKHHSDLELHALTLRHCEQNANSALVVPELEHNRIHHTTLPHHRVPKLCTLPSMLRHEHLELATQLLQACFEAIRRSVRGSQFLYQWRFLASEISRVLLEIRNVELQRRDLELIVCGKRAAQTQLAIVCFGVCEDDGVG
jgi:hypothetical protein